MNVGLLEVMSETIFVPKVIKIWQNTVIFVQVLN